MSYELSEANPKKIALIQLNKAALKQHLKQKHFENIEIFEVYVALLQFFYLYFIFLIDFI